VIVLGSMAENLGDSVGHGLRAPFFQPTWRSLRTTFTLRAPLDTQRPIIVDGLPCSRDRDGQKNSKTYSNERVIKASKRAGEAPN